MSPVATIILAAGTSQRMGSHKALLSIGQDSLLTYQVKQFKPLQGSIYIVLGHQAQDIMQTHSHLTGVNWLLNSDYEQGMSTSVRLGIQGIEPSAQAVFITPVDHLASWAVVEKMYGYFAIHEPLIVSPAHQGKRGHPVLFHGKLFDDLKNVQESTQGLRAIMQKYAQHIQTVDTNWLGSYLDLDYPEDYHQMLAFLKGTI